MRNLCLDVSFPTGSCQIVTYHDNGSFERTLDLYCAADKKSPLEFVVVDGVNVELRWSPEVKAWVTAACWPSGCGTEMYRVAFMVKLDTADVAQVKYLDTFVLDIMNNYEKRYKDSCGLVA